MLSTLSEADSIIKKMVIEEKCTLSKVSRELRRFFPYILRGLSVRSIRRYCADNGIHKTQRVKDEILDRVVLTNIDKV